MKINQLKVGVILSYVTAVSGALISMAYTPLMLRILGQSEYGLYTLAGSVVGYLNLLKFGISSAYIRYHMKYRTNNDYEGLARLNGMFLTVLSVLGAIALGAGLVLSASTGAMFSNKLSLEEIRITRVLIAVLSFNIALTFPAGIFHSYITAHEKFVFLKLTTLLKQICSPVLSLFVLLIGFRSIGMVVVTVIVSLAIDTAYFIFTTKKLNMRFVFRGFDKSLFKDVTTFSVFVFIHIIVDQVNWSVDKFLLGIYHGSVATAIYGLSAQLNIYFQEIPTLVSSVFEPRVHKLINLNDNNGVNSLFNRVGRLQFMLVSLVFTGFVFFGKPFIHYWGGKNYSDSYYIAILLFLPTIVPLIQNMGITIQRARYLHKFRSYVCLGLSVLNIIISIPLCKRYEGIGCAFGTAVSIIIGNVIVMNIYYHKKCGIDIIAFWKEILKFLPALILPILAGVTINLVIKEFTVFTLVLGITVYAVVFFASAWLLGMKEYEKGLILKPIKRVLRKI